MSLGVVIPVYNREHGLALTLESLKRQTLQNFSVVIADDGSTDGSRAVVERARVDFDSPRRLQWVSGGPNKGVRTGRARNIGARNLSTECECMVMLDCDVILPADALALFAEAHTRHPRAVVFGMTEWLPPLRVERLSAAIQEGRVADVRAEVPRTQPQRIDGTFVGPELREWLWPGLFTHEWDKLVPLQPEWAYSNNVLYPLEVFWQAGGFDERMQGYGYQDIEFGTRVSRLGQECILSSRIWCLHAWHPKIASETRLAEVQRNLDYLFRKHGFNEIFAGDINWTYWRHYHAERGGRLVILDEQFWVINEPCTHRLLLPSDQWIRRLGFASAGEARGVDDLQLEQIIDSGVASEVLADDTEYYY